MSEQQGGTSTAPTPPAAPQTPPKPAAAPPKLDKMPPWKVILHNDDVNDMLFVVRTLLEITPLDLDAAKRVMLAAHTQGAAMVLVTHKERAELYQDQFRSKALTVSIEPDA